MADIGRVFTGMLQRLPPKEQQLFSTLITPEFTQQMHQVNPEFASQLSQLHAPPGQTALPAPVQAPAAPQAAPIAAKTPTLPVQTPQPAPVEPKTNFADGGVVERGQAPTDPIAPAGAPAGQADDLQRNVSDGEVVVPADVVKAKGVDFFEKLKTTVREAQAKRTEEEAAAKAAKEGPGQPAPISVPPAPTSNVQPATTGPLSLPQGTGAARRNPLL